MSDPDQRPRVVVVGAGVAGLTAAVYTARHDFETVVVDGGEPILARNAHLENFPGFPAGVNSRTFLDLLREQARRNGVLIENGTVVRVEPTAEGFRTELADGDQFRSEYVVAASWSDPSYLEHLDLGIVQHGTKQFVGIDDDGRTDVDGLYAAGRLAKQYHQAVVAAGHGAQVAVTLLDDADVPFYHDWVAPQGYFTGRGRDVPPGCEEITEDECRRRERRSMEVMQDAFEEPHPEAPTQHPSVREDE